jgi:hypothetical protein
MLIRLPDSWPHWLIAVLAMLVLAVLDLCGALAAKEAVLRRSAPMGLLGMSLFLVLFWVYASSLRYAELAPVTLGWVVVLQVGVVLLDRFRYETPVSRGQWAAVLVVLAAQAYLLFGATSTAADTTAGRGDPPGRSGAGDSAPPADVPVALIPSLTGAPMTGAPMTGAPMTGMPKAGTRPLPTANVVRQPFVGPARPAPSPTAVLPRPRARVGVSGKHRSSTVQNRPRWETGDSR